MSIKYEFMGDDEIIKKYKEIKETERKRNKESYINLKSDEQKYKLRLKNALINQNERMNKIKNDENLYNEWLLKNKIIQSTSYYKRKAKEQELINKQLNLIKDFNNNI
jgi:hypothetical protein